MKKHIYTFTVISLQKMRNRKYTQFIKFIKFITDLFIYFDKSTIYMMRICPTHTS